MVWYFHLFKNFPQFVAIHRVKGFSIVYEAEVDFFFFFLEFSCFSYDPTDADNLISVRTVTTIYQDWMAKTRILFLFHGSEGWKVQNQDIIRIDTVESSLPDSCMVIFSVTS